MELVYLWVEEYKNIHRQGFNFSPRFRCEYDPDTNELTIDENDDYVDIFPDNINVTAIVGKNGSGKSSLLEFLLLMFFNSTNQENLSWGLLYDKKNRNFYSICFFPYQKNKGFRKVVSPKKAKKLSELYYYSSISKSKFQNIFYNPSYEIVSTSFKSNISNGLQNFNGSIYELDGKPDELNIFAFPSKEHLYINIYNNENIALINMFKTTNKQKKIISNILKSYKMDFIPLSIELNLDKQSFMQQIANATIKQFVEDNDFNLSLNSLYRIFLLSLIFYHTSETNGYKIYLLQDNKLKRYIEEKLYQDGINKASLFLYQNANEILTNTIGNQSFYELLKPKQFLHLNIYELAKLIDLFRKYNFTNDFLLNRITDKNIIIDILKYIPSYVKLKVYDKKNILFNDFSMGEKIIINQLYSISYYLDLYYKYGKYNINLIIDESELSLNPSWQKKLLRIYTLLFDNILKQYNITSKLSEYRLNVFISTHSPFFLSDIPKQNIIFLDTYKEEDEEVKSGKQKVGNCKVVDGLNEKKETFGANIHTLLSDSFFMEDGLMGEFAKGKIESIKKFYNKVIKYKDNDKVKKDYKCFYEKKQKEFWDIQSIIGEPFLQKIVKNQLEEIELILLGKNDAIDKEIARLQALKESFNND